jgi:3-methyladenine DNA glycosylase AlkD
MPRLRGIATEISKGNVRSYLSVATSKLYEERMLRGIVTGLVKTRSFGEFTELCDNFIEKEVDNWAICDCFCSGLKQVKKYKSEFFEYMQKYLASENEWEIRVALVIMLDYYLDEEYIDRVLSRCDNVKNDAYYVSMANAWLVATAVAKCREKTMEYLHNNSLDDVTFNRAIQKCIDSKRVDNETKNYLRKIKR